MEPLRINSIEEEQIFIDLIHTSSKVPIGCYHLGGFKIGNQWRWSDLSPVRSYMKWYRGEPNNAGGREFCMTIIKPEDGSQPGLNDDDCSSKKHRFFCQNPTTTCPERTARELELENELAACKLLSKKSEIDIRGNFVTDTSDVNIQEKTPST